VRSSLQVSLLIALVVGCSARDERVSRSALAVVGGVADTTDDAIAYITTTETATTSELCTGTLVAPTIVLTAGHCTLGQTPQTLVVGFASSSQFLSGTVPVTSVVTYPGFSGSDEDVQGGLDLGLVVLSASAPASPVAIDQGDASTFVGKSLRLVGYGYSDPASQNSSGTRLRADLTVTGACSALLAFGDAKDNACHGDSGGPLLATAPDGTVSIVGVVSFGDDLHCATSSYAVRVDRFLGWLNPYVANESAPDGCGCPVSAIDCAALEAGDAGVDAGSSEDASGDAVVPPASGPSPSHGCASAAVGYETSGDAGVLALVALGVVLSRRAQKRAVKLATPPPGRGCTSA
jgi:trypsin